ncbi:PKD domain-containing protein [Arthrobacter sulfonylureivorans]|uniref:PKD domain-containing protein n=1 Tax=Arthrobacter sulfonylureivorans TaxID=2486855 RepID=A0ABY3W4I6_9MICC|nr:PKD domain-containing protein [Arthrobacter sulfonylureivorans]UNK45114.1 PKD domain-containing protein [Arthrobacter sulfonylureivorans]
MLISIGFVFTSSISFAARQDDISLGQDGVRSEAWVQDPDTGMWHRTLGRLPLDPNGYRFEPLCLEDKSHQSAPCVQQIDRCTEGEGARLVQWYTGLSGTDRSTWAALGNPVCIYSEEPGDVLDEIAGQIQHQFEQRPVAAGEVLLQPNEHTLRGAHTNVFAVAQEQVFELIMLEQEVVIRAEPVGYAWTYGDGHSFGPVTDPGGPVPQDRWGEQTATSHIYQETGDYRIVLTTTFKGYYSVNGGQEIPIPNTADFSSAPVEISVWRSVVNNYADNCLENPEGAGC